MLVALIRLKHTPSSGGGDAGGDGGVRGGGGGEAGGGLTGGVGLSGGGARGLDFDFRDHS